MRLIAIAAFAGLLTTAAHADSAENCAAKWKSMSAADRGTLTSRDYMAACVKGKSIPPAHATARCKDGSYSTARTAQERCAGHGGVAMVITL
jgi:Protein of unknown function (DUF3761)